MSGKVSLSDKYTKRDGRVFLNGTQALVRLPMVQRWRDEQAGLNTGGFISGYRGSPLGNYDLELGRAKKYLDESHIKFEPGLNEDLGATAVWGTQQLELQKEHSNYDGVFGIWYGKGPGLDRSMDVIKHGNAAGSSPHGGVLCLGGDDHGAKSSTLPHQVDHNFMAAFMPELYPASIQEFVEYGLLGIEMSRYTGAWVGFKATAETLETSGTVDLSHEMRKFIIPTDFEIPEGGLNIRWPDDWREQDHRLQRYKGFAAMAFARANNVDRLIWDSPKPKFGIITSGKSYQDVRQALFELGIDENTAKDIGLRLYKVGMPWPLEPQGVRAFCEGLDEVLVVEEKREMIEHQLRWQLYNWKENVRPTVVGKHDENGEWQLPPENDLDVGIIAQVISNRMSKLYKSSNMQAKLDYFSERKRAFQGYTPAINRVPYFCSGCPHNSSTRVPEGSRATAGIGCHIMAINMDRNNETFTQMGGEGVPWVGQAPFTNEKHIFANLGDGTYNHSGSLAIRQCVAAGVNITYKILYNDAVAMTGGQEHEGALTVPQIVDQVLAERVKKVAIATERMEDYALINLPKGVEVHDRTMIMKLQEEFREIEGTTVIIYDQTCAAEKRRRRKRGKLADPAMRPFINEAICEGCGDCSVQSNCVSVEPLETEFGRKRTINQSSCNKDFSCVRGFCPSFVTVYGGAPRKSSHGTGSLDGLGLPALPDVTIPSFNDVFNDYNILVTGIGGTGVLTIGALLGMAAHLDGNACSILDMAGLAQKGGSVLSHIRLAPNNDTIRSTRIVTGRSNLLLACDSVVAASQSAVNIMRSDRTQAVINSHMSPVADFVRNRDIDFQEATVQKQLDNATLEEARFRIPAQEIATSLMGDSIATNILMLGYAWQKGMIPVTLASIEQAIQMNGVAIESNLRTFYWGRMAAHDMGAIKAIISEGRGEDVTISKSFDEIVKKRQAHLKAFQNAALAKKYTALLDRVRACEEQKGSGKTDLSIAVAQNYSKILSYKDEYEVARLYSHPDFKTKLKHQFEGKFKLKVHMAPPLISRIDTNTGRPKKREFGGWIFPALSLLAKFKFLRGTAFDPFGSLKDRKMERVLIGEYETIIEEIIQGLTTDNYDLAVKIASLPDKIRGYGPVKEETLIKTKIRCNDLLQTWRSGPINASTNIAAE